MNIDLSKLYPAPMVTTVGSAIPSGIYTEGWWVLGGTKHLGATYSSNAASTVSRQADLLQACGISMVNHTFYGMRESNILQSAQLWAAETTKRGMKFSLMIVNDMLNGVTTDLTQYVIDNLNQSGLLAVPSYIPEKAVWDFGVLKSVDVARLGAAFPSINFWREHTDYTWIGAPGTRAGQVKYEATQRLNGAMKAPSIWYQFNDANPADPIHSIWDPTKLARKVDGERGGMWHDLCSLPVPATAKYMMYGTLDDYEEGTALEGLMSAMTGIWIS